MINLQGSRRDPKIRRGSTIWYSAFITILHLHTFYFHYHFLSLLNIPHTRNHNLILVLEAIHSCFEILCCLHFEICTRSSVTLHGFNWGHHSTLTILETVSSKKIRRIKETIIKHRDSPVQFDNYSKNHEYGWIMPGINIYFCPSMLLSRIMLLTSQGYGEVGGGSEKKETKK